MGAGVQCLKINMCMYDAVKYIYYRRAHFQSDPSAHRRCTQKSYSPIAAGHQQPLERQCQGATSRGARPVTDICSTSLKNRATFNHRPSCRVTRKDAPRGRGAGGCLSLCFLFILITSSVSIATVYYLNTERPFLERPSYRLSKICQKTKLPFIELGQYFVIPRGGDPTRGEEEFRARLGHVKSLSESGVNIVGAGHRSYGGTGHHMLSLLPLSPRLGGFWCYCFRGNFRGTIVSLFSCSNSHGITPSLPSRSNQREVHPRGAASAGRSWCCC